jgi:hypothetical protein
VTLPDAAGVAGVLLILIAYGGVTSGRLDPQRPPALIANLVGAGLVLLSLAYEFNLAAALMEAAWVAIALAGLIRFALRRRR